MGRAAFKDFSARTVPLPREASLATFNASLREHPLLSLIESPWQGGHIRAARWSDHTTLRTFRRTALYNEYFRHTETQYQLATTVKVHEQLALALSFNRKSHDFDGGDLAMLDLLAPHVGSAIRAIIERMEVEKALALHELTTSDEAILIVGNHGDVLFASERARRLLRDYFPTATGAALPMELQQWVERNPSERDVLQRDRPEGHLTCRCGPTIPWAPMQNLLPAFKISTTTVRRIRLEERSHQFAALALQHLGLTPREAEVLLWMSEGKRNSEIATILQMGARTVDKHSEHIFAKLAVETRAGAVAVAWEAMA